VEANPPDLPESEGGEGSAEHRIAARANLMLSAAIEGEGFRASVRIRNLSETGALLEGPDLPPVGARLVLSRLKIQIAGTVMWSRAPRCGVRFEGRTSVADWIAGNASGGVDRGAQTSPLFRPAAPPPQGNLPTHFTMGSASSRTIDYRVGQELAALQELLKQVASDLGGGGDTAGSDPSALAKLAAATEIAGQLSLVLTSSDPLAAARSVTPPSLRERLAG
jgi:hypothetical protein